MIVNSITHEQRQKAAAGRAAALKLGKTLSLTRVTAGEQAALVLSSSNYFMNPTREGAKALGIERHIGARTSDYMLEERKKGERVAHVAHRNFCTDTLIEQQAEMIATMTVMPHGEHAFEHLVLSPGHGIRPDPTQRDEVPGRLLDLLGVGSHQAFVVWHDDTPSIHCHIGVSRVDRKTGGRVQLGDGWLLDTIGQAIAVIEFEQNWAPEARARYRANERGVFAVATGVKVRDWKFAHLASKRDYARIREAERGSEQVKLSAGAREFEHHHGVWSDERTAQVIAWPIIRDARSWRELHEQLARQGMRYEARGSGAQLCIGDRDLTATTANWQASIAKLKPRLREYEPADPKLLVFSYEPRRIAAHENKAAHAAAANEVRAQRAAARAAATTSAAGAVKALVSEHLGLQELINGHDWKGRGDDLQVARALAGAVHRIAKDTVETNTAAIVAGIRLRPRFPPREKWLRDGFDDTEEAEDEIVGILLGANGRHDAPVWKVAGYDVEDTGTERRYIKDRRVRFVDTGNLIEIRDRVGRETVRDALRLAARKWPTVHVTGDRKFMEMVVDLAIEHDIAISNPELQQQIKRKRAARASKALRTANRIEFVTGQWPFLREQGELVIVHEDMRKALDLSVEQMLEPASQIALRAHLTRQKEIVAEIRDEIAKSPARFRTLGQLVMLPKTDDRNDHVRASSWLRDEGFKRWLNHSVEDAEQRLVVTSQAPVSRRAGDPRPLPRAAAGQERGAVPSPADIVMWRAASNCGEALMKASDAVERLDMVDAAGPSPGRPVAQPDQPLMQDRAGADANAAQAIVRDSGI